MHNEWQVGDRRYLSEGLLALLYPDSDNGALAAIDSGEWARRTTSKPVGHRPARPSETKDF